MTLRSGWKLSGSIYLLFCFLLQYTTLWIIKCFTSRIKWHGFCSCLKRLHYFFFLDCLIYCCSVTVVLPFSPLLTLPHPPSPTVNSPTVRAQESATHIPLRALPSSFSHFPSPPSPLVMVSLFFISKSLVLLCSFVSFVDLKKKNPYWVNSTGLRFYSKC